MQNDRFHIPLPRQTYMNTTPPRWVFMRINALAGWN